MPDATSNGLRIGYDVAGSGEPALLLLPGWCDSRTQFQRLVPLCAQKRRVLAADLPGHGSSQAPQGDFGLREVVAAAAAVIEESGARQVVPVAMAHSGWVAIGLRRRLGAARIPKLVLLDWIVLDPPRPFLEALQALQDPEHWKSTRAQLFSLWLADADPSITAHVHRTMGDYSPGMWARAGREIAAAYAREGSPLLALSALDPPTPTLHLYALPKDEAYREAQESFAKGHPWFRARRLDGKTHFPPLETPDTVAAAIEEFLGRWGQS
jgi:pimeloyl-ACP methyl ester carboxylesterase